MSKLYSSWIICDSKEYYTLGFARVDDLVGHGKVLWYFGSGDCLVDGAVRSHLRQSSGWVSLSSNQKVYFKILGTHDSYLLQHASGEAVQFLVGWSVNSFCDVGLETFEYIWKFYKWAYGCLWTITFVWNFKLKFLTWIESTFHEASVFVFAQFCFLLRGEGLRKKVG